MASFKWDKTGLFAAGVLFGTAGIKLLFQQRCEKRFTQSAQSAVLRSKGLCNEDGYNMFRKMQVISMQMHSRSTEDRKAAEEAV